LPPIAETEDEASISEHPVTLPHPKSAPDEEAPLVSIISQEVRTDEFGTSHHVFLARWSSPSRAHHTTGGIRRIGEDHVKALIGYSWQELKAVSLIDSIKFNKLVYIRSMRIINIFHNASEVAGNDSMEALSSDRMIHRPGGQDLVGFI
jgi:hypothetical protein